MVAEACPEVVFGVNDVAKNLNRPASGKELTVRELISAVAECSCPLFQGVDLWARRSIHVGNRQSLNGEPSVEFVATDQDVNGCNVPVDSVDAAARVDEPKGRFCQRMLDTIQEILVGEICSSLVDQVCPSSGDQLWEVIGRQGGICVGLPVVVVTRPW